MLSIRLLEDVFGITPDETMVGFKLAKKTRIKLASEGLICLYKIIDIRRALSSHVHSKKIGL